MIESRGALEKGLDAHRAGRLGEAEDHYLALLAATPGDDQVLRLLGLLRQGQGRLGEAVALLARAAARLNLPVVFGDLAAALSAAGLVAEAAETFGRARPAPGPRHGAIKALLDQARERYQAGRAVEAFAAYRTALILDPGPEAAEGVAACLLIEAGNVATDQAIDLCRVASRLHPVAIAHSKLGSLLYATRPSEAALHAVTAFRLDPTMNHLEMAATILTRLVTSGRAMPDGLPGYVYALGEGNHARQQGDPPGAEACWRRAAALCPELPFAHARLGHLAWLGGRLDEADAHLRRADRHGPARENVMRLGAAFLAGLEAGPPPEPALEGLLAETDAPLVVVSSCDGGYFDRYGRRFAETLAATAGMPFHLHLHLIGADGGRAEELARRAGVASLSWTTQPDQARGAGRDRSTYYACQRFLALPRLLRHYQRPVLLLDIDLVVLRPLALLLERAGAADVAAVGGTPLLEPWNQLWADVLLLRPTPATLRFVDLVARYIGHFLDEGSPRWFLDQLALFAAWRWLDARGAPLDVALLPTSIHRDDLRDGDERIPDCLFWSFRASVKG
ncbi:MAG: tetratricopeptide repeat protein [Alphaproteobacteria bacterium]|nr:tetratricopeptide repeat protein [Alphaproteobacteria bacterium]